MPEPADPATLDWLLAGDPAIRWQTLRDLTGAGERAVTKERNRVSREGWGGRLLALQDPAGTWAATKSSDGGLYTPKWTSTTYTMLLLRDFGLSAGNRQARRAAAVLLDEGLQGDGSIGYGTWTKWSGRGETCVTSMVLSLLAYFGIRDRRVEQVAQHLLGEQMEDGGWNCRRASGATHSSVNTTISALEAMYWYGVAGGRQASAARRAAGRGREFLLAHRLFRSHRTGNVIKPAFTRLVFPPRWHYDILRALDHFQLVNAPRDPRLAEAIEIVQSRREPDGRWLLPYAYPGKVHFSLEKVGAPSRWNTLRALRVLAWWKR